MASAQGTTTVDFGAFPGACDASVAVTGQAAIVASSIVEAWLYPVATADHSADEHRVAPMKVRAATIVAGTGFTIYAQAEDNPGVGQSPDRRTDVVLKDSLRLYGLWTVAWCWSD